MGTEPPPPPLDYDGSPPRRSVWTILGQLLGHAASFILGMMLTGCSVGATVWGMRGVGTATYVLVVVLVLFGGLMLLFPGDRRWCGAGVLAGLLAGAVPWLPF